MTYLDEHDLVSLKKSYRELNYKFRILEHIFSMTPGHVYWKGKDGVYLGCNDTQAQTLGYNKGSDIVGKKDQELPWTYEDFERVDRQVLETKAAVSQEESSTLPNGESVVYYSTKRPLLDPDTSDTIGVIGVSFDITALKEKERLQSEKSANEKVIKEIENIAGSMAHELRTPLAAVYMGVDGMMKLFPALLQGYQLAVANKLMDQKIRSRQFEALSAAVNNVLKQVVLCQEIINRQLDNIKYRYINPRLFEPIGIKAAILSAIEDFPFQEQQKSLVSVSCQDDFIFKGDEIFTRNVIWNLLKNALHFIEEEGRGEITIWSEKNQENNKLHIKDTAKGIKQEDLPHIFDNLYSKRKGGTGVGLAHCKMVMQSYGGSISCDSVYGVYTTFTLTFPRLST